MGNKKIRTYEKRILLRNCMILSICLILLIASFLISMNTGYIKLSPSDTWRTLIGHGTDREHLILFQFRLPRIIISMLIGAGLSLSGCIIQGITKNPLADPGLLGINAGAGFMVVLFVMLFGSNTFFSVFTLPILALLGAGITSILIYLLSYKKGEGIAPLRLVLTGIAVQAGITALMTLLIIKLDEDQFNFVATWQAGSIWGSNWKFVVSLLPWIMVLIPYTFYKARILDVLSLGMETARGLGVHVEKENRKLLIASVALAASCVAVSGNISFIGLIAPHLARRLVGPKHKILIPTCALIGAVLVSVSDTLARMIVQPSELPTGVMVAIVGAPYFLYLLIKSKK